MTELVKTGIDGLDVMLSGGFPRGSTVLLSGKIGTGKTVFAMQFLYYGAVKYNEPGVFVTVDERPEDLRKEMLNFGWDIAKLEKQRKLAIIDVSSLVAELPSKEKYKVAGELSIDNVVSSVIDAVNSLNAKRLIFDSIPALAIHTDIESLRRLLHRLNNLLLNLGCTSILTTEIEEGSMKLSKYGIGEYLARGVVILDLIEDARGAVTRTVKVRKMREVNHDLSRRPMHITAEGIIIYPSERVFMGGPEF